MKQLFLCLLIVGLTTFCISNPYISQENSISLIEEYTCRDKLCGSAGNDNCSAGFECKKGKCKRKTVKCKGIGKSPSCQSDEKCSWGSCVLAYHK